LEDIPLLATKFLRDIAYRHARPEPSISPAALAELAERSWPGNVRQLQHEIERAFVFCNGTEVRPDDLSEMPKRGSAPYKAVPQQGTQPRELRNVVAELQNEQIRDAIAACGGNKRKAAASLGISRSFLYKKLSEISETNNS
jgi:DNA-binding NtrC family response regulator